MSGKELLITAKAEENLIKEMISIVFSYLYEMICLGG